MDQDLVPYLPPEIMFDILLRLPARTIMICKCVCKSWLDMLATPQFVTSHHTSSAPGLAIFEWETQPKPYKIVEFVDEVDLNNSHEPRWNVVFDFNLPFDEPPHSSANGLLFHKSFDDHGDIFISNPITREYTKLPSPPQPYWIEYYGFGVSRMSGQYKVVRIFYEEQNNYDRFECQIYTVGTGLWRRIALDDQLSLTEGAFLNGNIHWLARGGASIFCLDLETEIFRAFSPPPLDPITYRTLSVVGDCLCVCDTFNRDCRTDIWMMNEYGEAKSWTKEFVIRKLDEFIGYMHLIKAFKDGDLLIEWAEWRLAYYSCKTETTRLIDVSGFDRNNPNRSIIYTPTFLPLKTFAMENVSSF